MVELELPKLMVWVRFPSSAPYKLSIKSFIKKELIIKINVTVENDNETIIGFELIVCYFNRGDVS